MSKMLFTMLKNYVRIVQSSTYGRAHIMGEESPGSIGQGAG